VHIPLLGIGAYDGLVCTDDSLPVVTSADIRFDAELATTIPLEPVDSVVVTTLMDNVTDIFMPN